MISIEGRISVQRLKPKQHEIWLMFLHIYAQQHEHDTSWIVGDKQSLTALRDALDKAIADHHASMSSFTADGEGFITTVVVTDDDKTKNKMMLPYAETRDRMLDAPAPFDLISREEYKKLHKEPDFK